MFAINIGLLGLGTVGRGVYDIINNHWGTAFQNGDADIKITKILVSDLTKDRGKDLDYSLLTLNADDILLDENIDIVVAVLGGSEPELSYVLKAMENNKSVVTANKQIVSENMELLFQTAQQNEVSFMFEASVGGGIPIIETMLQLLKINKVDMITGILNGTMNFILSQMSEFGTSFEEALKKAQELGFAEADPTADVMGFDVSRKLSILSSLAFSHIIKDEDIYKRGIVDVSAKDIEVLKNSGYIVKFVAHSFIKDGKYYASAEPAIIKENTHLSSVNDEYNVVILNGNIIGELVISGKGAGKNPTANAVVGDILYMMNQKSSDREINFSAALPAGGTEKITGRYYIRTTVHNDEQFDTVYDCVDRYILKKDTAYEDGVLYFFTEEIASPIAQQIENELRPVVDNIFYARIIE